MQHTLNEKENLNYISQFWDNEIVPSLQDYIKIPNKSPQFDSQWREHGFMGQAVDLISAWCRKHAVEGMKIDVLRLENRTPLLFIDIPGKDERTILLYGHLDKQPEMTGWDEELHPWQPVLRKDKLYGRGAADDGYAAYAALTAIKSLQKQSISHSRCIILIEACEESGSYDLPFYIDALKNKIKNPSLVICLDSGCGNYDQLWVTTSLRGLVGGILTIEVLKQGVHSGAGSGIIPSCFRILRQLLERIEDAKNGDIKLSSLLVEIPAERKQQAEFAAQVLGQATYKDFPLVNSALEPESLSFSELILRRTWLPALSVIGMDGLPIIENAGNVTIPKLAIKLSIRLPPLSDPNAAASTLKAALEENNPYGANISFEINDTGPGWNAPKEEIWLSQIIDKTSNIYFGKKAVYMGEGGSIPFMGMLGKKFPQAQFLITGVLGPGSNAHGPNEFLHIPTGKKITACIAQIIAESFKR